MRELIAKYDNDCANCGEAVSVGDTAMYEKRMGIFHPGCEPTDTEGIREYRQAHADRRADRYEARAATRERKADELRGRTSENLRTDWAFITQPGHIPEREKMNRRDEKAYGLTVEADKLRQRASGVRHVAVKGDADRKRDARREKVMEWLEVGMRVNSVLFGTGTVTRISKKTARMDFDRGFNQKDAIEWLTPA